MRRKLVAGNAKMNLDRESVVRLLEELNRDLAGTPAGCDVALCPPFPLLPVAQPVAAKGPVRLGGQDVYWESQGAFTGAVSAGMLLECGCRYVIVGHSERRALFGETDEMVRRKAGAALEAGLVPIVCVGETEKEREAGATEVVLSRQMVGSLSGLAPAGSDALVLAYEPVWAIGTGKNATPEQAQEAHAHLRNELARLFGETAAAAMRILYGGSVKGDNAEELMGRPDVDGALVGGASLSAGAFLPIIRAAG